MKFIIGKKLDMTQTWQEEKVVAVTRVQAEPCIVVQVRTEDKDGYKAVQLGAGEKKKKNIRKPQLGHMKKLGNFKTLREFRVKEELQQGDKIDISIFKPGDKIQVTSASKGKGFQGVVKRHGFHGQDTTHGTKDQVRMPGSIGATGPAHVFKGTRMPGRMGGKQVTVKNLEIIKVDLDKNELLIKGAVPGARNGLVLIKGEGELKLKVESDKVNSRGSVEKRIDEAVKKEETAEKIVNEKKNEDKKEKNEEPAEENK